MKDYIINYAIEQYQLLYHYVLFQLSTMYHSIVFDLYGRSFLVNEYGLIKKKKT